MDGWAGGAIVSLWVPPNAPSEPLSTPYWLMIPPPVASLFGSAFSPSLSLSSSS